MIKSNPKYRKVAEELVDLAIINLVRPGYKVEDYLREEAIMDTEYVLLQLKRKGIDLG